MDEEVSDGGIIDGYFRGRNFFYMIFDLIVDLKVFEIEVKMYVFCGFVKEIMLEM